MSEKQNAYLKAMDIDVWIERTPSVLAEKTQSAEPIPVPVQSEPAQPVSEIIPEAEPEVKVNIEALDWQDLQSAVAECESCELSQVRSKTIFGSGNQVASLMIIGDAPNAEDEQQGDPFAGQAGKLLTAMLKAMGYQRNDVYISTLVKCRTPENQDPSIEQVAACEKYLIRQIELVKPDLILALGSITAQRLLKSKSTMSRLRGQLHYLDNINVPIIVSFEPAYLLRSPNEKRKAWEDLQMAMKALSDVNASSEVSALDKGKNS